MRLCVSSVLLLLALTWATADPILTAGPEECSKLDKLRTITDRHEVVGHFYFVAAYADNDVTRSLLEVSHTFWGDMSLTEDGLYVEEYGNMNGTCLEFRSHISYQGDTAKSSLGGISSEFKLHNFTSTLFIMDLNTTMTNSSAILKSLNLDASLTHGQDTITSHCYYLISREKEVSEADMQLFKDHAKCAGFTGGPAYVSKSDHEYCAELNSVPFSPEPECYKFNKLDTITDKTQIAGPFYFMAAYTDNKVFKNIFGLTTSIRGEISLSEDGFHVQEFPKMNGTCLELNLNVTHSEGISTATMPGMKSMIKFRSFAGNSRVMDVILSSPNIVPVLQGLHIDPSVTNGQSKVKGRALYLISKVPEVNKEDMDLFKKYANCRSYRDEPALLNKGDNDYCSKESSIRLL